MDGQICKVYRKRDKSPRDYFNSTTEHVTAKQLQSLVLDYYNILSWDYIKAGTRSLSLVCARQVYCWLCNKHLTGINDSIIASHIGKDRTTVVRSIQRIDDLLFVKDDIITKCVRKIEMALTQPQIKA